MNRRPIKTRNTAIAQRIAQWLATTAIKPDHISILSMVAAGFAGVSFYVSAQVSLFPQVILLLLAAALCQGRLLCNLFDGMLATQAGKSSAGGALWNEFPDRFADVFILVGVGCAVDAAALGWAAAAMAIMTAYVRELGTQVTGITDFSGPMAKPHRMAVMTVAALLAVVEAWWLGSVFILEVSLWIVVSGALYTSVNRLRRLFKSVE